MRKLILVSALLFCINGMAQKIFTDADLVNAVARFHPVARSAGIGVAIAKADIRTARGAFDPVLSVDNARKDFDGINYYDQQFTEVKIPTWYGIEVTGGTESINGIRTNPEETKGSINYLGVSFPLLQGLLMDKRRAALQQAKIYFNESEQLRRSAVNDLLLEALSAYWNWWEYYQQLTIVRNAVLNASQRMNMVKRAWQLGDRPAIDTVDAYTQVQQFQQMELEMLMRLANAQLELSTFLWTANGTAYTLPEDVAPMTVTSTGNWMLDSLVQAASQHPELQAYQFKLQALEVDRRYKFQSLLPKVDLKYNRLGRDVSKTFQGAWFNNNYRFGVAVSVPLRLSEGRGSYQAARLKIQQTTLEQMNKQVQVTAKVKQGYTEWQQALRQVQLQQQLVASYNALLKGEETRFLNGESSMFLVNARELKAIEAQQKQVEIQHKLQSSAVKLQWSAGILVQ